MKERRAKMRTAARSTAHPPPPPPIRRKESTATAATVNSSVMEGYGNALVWHFNKTSLTSQHTVK